MEGEMYRSNPKLRGDLLLALSGTIVLAILLFRMASYAPIPTAGAEALAPNGVRIVPTVEILARDGAALAQDLAGLEKLLAAYGDRVRVVRYDPATSSGAGFARQKGLHGDEKLTIFVNGTQTFTLDGRTVSFESLPDEQRADGWTLAQLDAVLRQMIGN